MGRRRPVLAADLNIPFTDKLPQPAEVMASAYDFAEQLLAAQRKFAEDTLAAIAPLYTSESAPSTKKAGTTAK